jgi:DNA-binding response OmpR family regulator
MRVEAPPSGRFRASKAAPEGTISDMSHLKRTILVVEDEESITIPLAEALERDGFNAEVVHTVEDALGRGRTLRPDLVLLDIGLPDGSGLDVRRELRSSSNVPIIILSARGEEADRVVGLELGADDYVTKPFSPRELTARVRTVLRRAEPEAVSEEHLTFNGLAIDSATREVTKSGTSLRLTAREFDLLWFLASHPRRVFSREDLMRRVWGYSAALDTGTVTVHVRRLREKIEEQPSHPRHLETVWGVGYRFTP